ncbi:hypothetical protein BJY01DRAFT_240234 [Aspergillus pseudoustus]|uniref:NAD(P)-binding protein n=1 Tax=Aspergillus pseudoustus TaxID=1810923 RepID=A0ABR4ITQ1_9EURO
METVLVVGATGNIGVSVIRGALNSGRNVLAIVRSQASADKLVRYIGSAEGITFVEANVAADDGVQDVVDKVRAGQLPAFQHVYSCVGGEYITTLLPEITTERLHSNMNLQFEAAFFAYRATIPYLLSQPNAATWTVCTGSQGDIGTHALPAMTQGALFSFATAAARETAETNVRFNEVYLAFRVLYDDVAVAQGVTKASDFVPVYEAILAREEIRSARVWVETVEDIKAIRFTCKF